MPASRPAAGPSARGRRIAYCVFDTSLGWRGIAWTECGDSGVPSAVVRFQLPEATSKATGTETYGELARAIGQPTAARAVGLALGRNPIALIIPCHRGSRRGRQAGQVLGSRRKPHDGEDARTRRRDFRTATAHHVGEGYSTGCNDSESARLAVGALHGETDRVPAQNGAITTSRRQNKPVRLAIYGVLIAP
ncbi:MAG: methylated-DNA--[protein]-cysteine S-methyltransferase [Vulcanimicrobiaceae bacterium]